MDFLKNRNSVIFTDLLTFISHFYRAFLFLFNKFPVISMSAKCIDIICVAESCTSKKAVNVKKNLERDMDIYDST